MDTVTLSRIQFAATTYFHFIFVPLTLGLSILTAWMQTVWYRTGDEDYKRMTKFWGKLFLINFALGVVTGITLEFQFGTNWSGYAKQVGDIFGSLLAVEATVAFFLESTFIAVWVFGWDKVNKKLHLASIWIVAVASNLSAFWILVANSWMQRPVGYVLRNGRAELNDFLAVVTSRWALLTFVHVLGGAFILAGFFVMGISAWHLLRKQHVAFFKKSFTIGATFALVFSFFEIAQGHMNAEMVGQKQKAKFAAMESVWTTKDGAGMHLLQWPDPDHEKNTVQTLTVPKALSFLATYDGNARVVGLKDIPKKDRPPVTATFVSFRAMVGFAFAFLLLSFLAWWKRKDPLSSPWLLRLLVYAIPLPYLVNFMGWTVTEIGRQPWIVYGMLRVDDAVSPVSVTQVLTSLIAFGLVYTLLGIADIYLLAKYARKGPEPTGDDAAPSSDEPLTSGAPAPKEA